MDHVCPNCGADNLESARYCRKCGVRMGPDEFHEAPTRNFEDKRMPDFATAPGPDPLTAPQGRPFATAEPARYVPPAQAPGGAMDVPRHGFVSPPAAYTTGPLKKSRNLPFIVGMVAMVIVLVALVIGLPLIGLLTATLTDGGPATKKGGDAPPPATAGGGSTKRGEGINPDTLPDFAQEWVYPDAPVTSWNQFPSMGKGESGGALKQESSDTLDDVFEFYNDRVRESTDRAPIVNRSADKAGIVSGRTIIDLKKVGGLIQITVVFPPGGAEMYMPEMPEMPEIPEPPEPGIGPGEAPPPPPRAPEAPRTR